MSAESPTITSVNYAQLAGVGSVVPLTWTSDNTLGQPWQGAGEDPTGQWQRDYDAARRRVKAADVLDDPLKLANLIKQNAAVANQRREPIVTTRLVKVFIVDPEESLPLEDRLLYKSDEFLTDSSDQELYFDIDIKGLLAKHNEKRLMTIDKKTAKGAEKPQRLEAARVRDLRMQVVVLLSF